MGENNKIIIFVAVRLKFNIKLLFIPKTVKFWPKIELKFFRPKTLNNTYP